MLWVFARRAVSILLLLTCLHGSNETKHWHLRSWETTPTPMRQSSQEPLCFVFGFTLCHERRKQIGKVSAAVRLFLQVQKNVNGPCVQLLKPILLWRTRKNEPRGPKGKEWVSEWVRSTASFSDLDLSVPGLFRASKTLTVHTHLYIRSAPLPFTEHHEENSAEAEATQKPLICLLGCWCIDADELVSRPSVARCLPLFLSLQRDIIYQPTGDSVSTVTGSQPIRQWPGTSVLPLSQVLCFNLPSKFEWQIRAKATLNPRAQQTWLNMALIRNLLSTKTIMQSYS